MQLLAIIFAASLPALGGASSVRGRAGSLVARGDLTRQVPKPVEELQGHGWTVYDRLMAAPRTIPRDMRRDEQLLNQTFFPGYEPNVPVLALTGWTVVYAILWFACFIRCCYRNDRQMESKSELKRLEREVDVFSKTMLFGWLSPDRFVEDNKPDMVIVFPNPANKTSKEEGDQDIPTDKVYTIVKKTFNKIKFNAVDSIVAHDRKEGQVKLGAMRQALIKDISASLPDMGFQADAFCSIDGDEIFLCISLDNESIIQKYLIADHGVLQLKSGIMKKLGCGVCADPEADIPPSLEFDRNMVTQLASSGVIEADDPRGLYVASDGRSEQGCLLSGCDRFRTIYKSLSLGVDLETAQEQGYVHDFYPAHELRRLQLLGWMWGNLGKLKDFYFKQPIAMIKEYFGLRVAFMFVFNGVYCRALLALVPLGLLWEAGGLIAPYVHPSIGPNSAYRQILGMQIIVLIWAKLALNLYDREQAFFMRQWDLNPDLKVRLMRPQYKGILTATDYDSKVSELQAPKWDGFKRSIVSNIITVFAVLFVALCIMIWVSIFDGNMNVVASLVLTCMISGFQIVFNVLSRKLSDWENHKWADDYYNSYLLKQFLFSFVSSYWAFFFLAIKQRHTSAGCPEAGCLFVMRKQLTLTLTTLYVVRIVLVLVQCGTVRLKIFLEDRALKKELKVEQIPKRSFVEEQTKYANFDNIEQIQAMLQLIIPVGHVIIFGGIAPITILFAFGVFAFSLRAQGFCLCTSTKRPLPREEYGIGRWYNTLHFFMNLSVLFSGFILAVYDDMLVGQQRITKLSIVILFTFIIYALWVCVDVCLPPTLNSFTIMAQRRKRAMALLHETMSDAMHAGLKDSTGEPFQRRVSPTLTAIAEGDWDSIKKSADAEEKVEYVEHEVPVGEMVKGPVKSRSPAGSSPGTPPAASATDTAFADMMKEMDEEDAPKPAIAKLM